MRPTILLTGRSGQIGSELGRLLPEIANVAAPDRKDLNLLKPDMVRDIVRAVKPQLIVNAAAYTAVDAAENDEATARAVNADAPALLAKEASRIGAALLHYSTDYVFDGTKTAPYEESDRPSPLNAYGRTKLAGEQAVSESGVAHLIFRTAWVYSTRRQNFLLTILRLSTEREELKIVCDQVGSPTRALDIATATCKILAGLSEGNDERALHDVSGIYHMTAAGQASWHDFATAILEVAIKVPRDTPWFAAATQGRTLVTRRVLPITSTEYGSATHRPSYSVLSNVRLTRTFNCTLSNWRDQLHQAFASEAATYHFQRL
jgi:dTDP-4-dehydrorhamnose reductase